MNSKGDTMQAAKSQARTADSLVDRARTLVDRIRARAERTERERCIPPETIEEFKESGLLRALQAKRCGGLERSPAEFFEAVIEIAAACGSSGWALGVLGVHPFEAAQLPVEAQDEIYGDDPNTLISSSYAETGQVRRVPGGFRLSGRWYFSSCCDYGSWAVLGGIVPPDGETPAERRIFYLPRRDYRIEDDWYVMGLAGSGSKSIIVDDAFVPEYRTLRKADRAVATGPGLAVNTSPLFRLPFVVVFSGAIVTPAIGAAKGAYQAFSEQARKRVQRGPSGEGRSAAEDPFLQLRLAETAAEIADAELRLLHNYREMMELAEAGKEITAEDRVRYRWQGVRAVSICSLAVHRLFEASGGHVLYLTNPLQRFYRDILAMRQHIGNHREYGAVGLAQAVLGLPVVESIV